MTVHVFGIRHHGPGCARSLGEALGALAPDAVLIEGPPDADGIIGEAGDAEIEPPVALLVYAPERPGQAVFYPFAAYSPEWRAMQHALQARVPVRFIDLPQAPRLAEAYEQKEESTTEAEEHDDPLGLLSQAAGFADRELWWEQEVEARHDAAGLFEGIVEAMTALRERAPTPSPHEARREAYMRQAIRAAQKEGFQRIAVVCGAWHAPALATLGPARRDAELLRGLPRTKVACTWIPWTTQRLSYRSGYGAGVESPGWYAHLWAHRGQVSVRWATRAAHLLRAEDLDASSASVIETVRLADALAALRELSTPGLTELREAVQAVLCQGETSPMALIRDRLEIGHQLGRVPARLVAAPLQRELEAEQRRLRMKVSAERVTLELDLRKDNDRERGLLLRRLDLLGVAWGRLAAASGQRGAGTFREAWERTWQPEMVVSLIEASAHGNTIVAAASGRLRARAPEAELGELCSWLDGAVLAELPDAVDGLLTALQARVALSADVSGLLAALPPLSRIVRYGDVRGTRAEQVRPALVGLFERAVVGLPGACVQIDDDAAARVASAIAGAHQALLLLDDAALTDEWLAALARLVERDAVHARVRGLACRQLLERGRLAQDELGRLASLALSSAVAPAAAAAWIEGLVGGPGLLLLHQDLIWTVLDAWLAQLQPEAFVQVLPLLRRAFADFAAAERRQMGAKLSTLGAPAGAARAAHAAPDVDAERAARVLPVLAHILGVNP